MRKEVTRGTVATRSYTTSASCTMQRKEDGEPAYKHGRAHGLSSYSQCASYTALTRPSECFLRGMERICLEHIKVFNRSSIV